MKRVKQLFLISAVLLLPLLILVIGTISGEMHRFQTRHEIFEYVEDHKESIDLQNPEYTRYFEYSEWGFGDAGVKYGYIYSPDTDYASYGEKYRRGSRIDGPTTYGYGWFYYEEICENWYYYEEHYG